MWKEAQRATYRAPEYNVPHLLPHLGFLIGPKNTNFVEDTEILLSINFRQIQFSCFRAVLSKKKMSFADSMSLTLYKSYLSSNAKLVYISRAQTLCKSYLSFNANCPIKRWKLWFRQICRANLKKRKYQYMKTPGSVLISLTQYTKRDNSLFAIISNI